VTSPEVQQVPEAREIEAGTMVRVCERCGTVCSTDQEWCLSCGVRLTEASQRLPGLRAAGLVVALAVVLAGGAAAASYAALRGDSRTAADVTTDASSPAVTPPPATPPAAPTTPVTPPTTTTVPPAGITPPSSVPDTAPIKPEKTPKVKTPTTPKTPSVPVAPVVPPSTPSGSGSSGSSSSGSSSGSSGSSSSGSGSKSGSGSSGSKDDASQTGPVTFAPGQGSIYDPDGLVADRGVEGNAIDGDLKSSWKVTLNAGATGGFGYVMDFDDPAVLKTLKIVTGTDGLVVKVYGTKKTTLPPDQLDLGWDTLTSDTTLDASASGTTLKLKAVSGAVKKYKHVLVWITQAPGTPAAAQIKELIPSR
jgi:hypothetical protein